MTQPPSDVPFEADQADAQDQAREQSAVEEAEPDLPEIPLEADAADAVEQSREVYDGDDEDYSSPDEQ